MLGSLMTGHATRSSGNECDASYLSTSQDSLRLCYVALAHSWVRDPERRRGR